MKKILSSAGILFCLVLFSCKKSDEKLIIGTWEAKSATSITYINGVLDDQDVESFAANELTVEFKENNTYTTYQNGVAEDSGTYSLENDKLTIDGYVSDYTISKKNLSIKTSYTDTNGAGVYRNETELKLEKK